LSFANRSSTSGVLSVTQYASRLGSAVRHVGEADLEGEVQRVQRRANGMYWFSLTDGEAVLSCKIFARDAVRLEHQPKEGDLVRVRVDRPDFYAAQGSVSLIVSALSLAGEGELLRRRAELLARLQGEGLCDPDRRRALPEFPRAVGVIAGADSDGMSDVMRALRDRWPCIHIVVCSSAVQGKRAPAELIDSLALLQEHALVDVIVVARGGGSVQDLVCFDDERLCRAMFACAVPIVCAIGHTDNNPVCNHVAWSAFTPSRSAELVVPSAAELRHKIRSLDRVLSVTPGTVQHLRRHLEAVAAQVNCGQAIGLRAATVRAAGQRTAEGMRSSMCQVALGLQRGRETLAATPLRASRQLTGGRETLSAAGRTFDRTAEHLAELGWELQRAGLRVSDGIRRQLADHSRDYGRATERLMREAKTGLGRRQARVHEDLSRNGRSLAERINRRVDDARRSVGHQVEVVAARDFRRHGWLLASRAGQPVRSASDLSEGDVVELHLHDGHATAVIGQRMKGGRSIHDRDSN
jgi:exodeoxyribonuclease VII large subunit